jgi:hypothetical protein|tara:strand:+ start:2887 stop:3642 length:756 start_codon:yes stop_codon:yes gene_type:complete
MEFLNLIEILNNLKDDEKYYGSYGKQWLSNSDIGTLLGNPKNFRKPQTETKPMIEGRYFHTAMLEPHKLDDFISLDVKSRNTKAYKEYVLNNDKNIYLLDQEVDNLKQIISVMKNNHFMRNNIFASANYFEVPMVKTIMGIKWKGKADIVCEDKLIDIKTTSDIQKFKFSARKYNYDSQAYIYQELFSKPLVFYVIDKTTHDLGIYEPTQDFLQHGKEKVEKAIEVYNAFYNEDGPHMLSDINQYIHYEKL